MPSKPGEYAWAREGEILRCPWHGWEFDITTERSEPAAGSDEDERVETYPVSVEDGFVVLHV
jgi:3-phenylpropionate/trans-cinnamate dioxygenase ferredoxin subunit